MLQKLLIGLPNRVTDLPLLYLLMSFQQSHYVVPPRVKMEENVTMEMAASPVNVFQATLASTVNKVM